MDKAASFEGLVNAIANELSSCDYVRYDIRTLEYGGIFEYTLWEYDIDSEDEDPDEMIQYLREVMSLPERIDKPESKHTFTWMEMFTYDNETNRPFFLDAIYALQNRHPFRNFRLALDRYGLTHAWYPYRDELMREYVRKEITPPSIK